ncbi:MAG: hypothetical protein Q4B22_11965 [Eubacteriales bacterium]|nr:hypothetical protein [Eubacteriales bacterium]
MNIGEMLDILKSRARKDPALREQLLLAGKAEQPLRSFCRICRENGFEIYEMDLLSAGEDAYAAMRRSTNGGGENSPLLDGEDDYFEMFMADL